MHQPRRPPRKKLVPLQEPADRDRRGRGLLVLLAGWAQEAQVKEAPYTSPKVAWQMRRNLKARRDTAWTDALANIHSKKLRIQVACVVWWDFYSDRRGKRIREKMKQSTLRGYLDAWNPRTYILPRSLYRALVKIGYVPKDAKARAYQKAESSTPQRNGPSKRAYFRTKTSYALRYKADAERGQSQHTLAVSIYHEPPDQAQPDPFEAIDALEL